MTIGNLSLKCSQAALCRVDRVLDARRLVCTQLSEDVVVRGTHEEAETALPTVVVMLGFVSNMVGVEAVGVAAEMRPSHSNILPVERNICYTVNVIVLMLVAATAPRVACNVPRPPLDLPVPVLSSPTLVQRTPSHIVLLYLRIAEALPQNRNTSMLA